MENLSLEEEFVDYIEHLNHQAVSNAEIEINKAKECRNMLELPARKENWDIKENAENDMTDHLKKAMIHLREVVILSTGLEVFKNGLIYNTMKSSKKVK